MFRTGKKTRIAAKPIQVSGAPWANSVGAISAGAIALIILTAIFPVRAQEATAGDGAVVMTYHRFGETEFPSTSVEMTQFRAHIEALKDPAYTVMPLPEIVAALQSGSPLPDRTVGLSIDDAYLSAFQKAWPLLREAGFPFTLFVATDPVDRNRPGYMSWDQIRTLAANEAVTIGSQTMTHPHMPTRSVARNDEELRVSADRIEAELGKRPTLLAYPYGETSLVIMEQARATGYTAAFGQHSGVANRTSDPYFLPRFPINVNYGSIERFRRLINTVPLPIHGLTPRDPLLPAAGPGNPPSFGFTVDHSVRSIQGLVCYHSDTSKIMQYEVMGNRVEVRFDGPFAPGRTRINCTLQYDADRWRWFGMQYYTPLP